MHLNRVYGSEMMDLEIDAAQGLSLQEPGLALMQEPASPRVSAPEVEPVSDRSETSTVEQVAYCVEKILRRVSERRQCLRVPQSTYRIQFNSDFTFEQATKLIAYWNALGITEIYASPYLKAVAGSRHGYDIVDHAQLNPEVGTAEQFDAWVTELRHHQMGHVLDFVPNHMGVASNDNGWWQDVLENGPSSRYAPFFDIAWRPLKADLKNKVLLPVLGGQFGQVLEDQQLQLSFQSGAFFVNYYSRSFPIAPRSTAMILKHRVDELAAQLGAEAPDFLEYQSILTSISHLPEQSEKDPARLEERHREKEIIKRRLRRLCEENATVQQFIDQNITEFNGRKGDPGSFDLLDELLQQQAYRLSFWRVAADEINYRRFFDVNELAAVCMERPEVFEAAHALVMQLLDQGKLDGMRIDHADGLYDPTAYLWQLQECRFLQLCRQEYARLCSEGRNDLADTPDAQSQNSNSADCKIEDAPTRTGIAAGAGELTPAASSGTIPNAAGSNQSANAILETQLPGTSSSETWEQLEPLLRERFHVLRETEVQNPMIHPLYVVVEKIMERHERLPDNWPVQGTTGYEFMNDANGVFVDLSHAKQLDAIYSRFLDRTLDFDELVYDSKRLIVKVAMSSEIHVLGHQLDRISERNRWTRDFTLHGLITALREVVAAFPIYRTYTVDETVLDRDRDYVERAIRVAKQRNRSMNRSAFDFIRDVLLHQNTGNLSDQERNQRREFVGRFQQFTGPMMAKSVEDTAFYRYHRLISTNEVGGDPRHLGITVSQFHTRNLERQQRRPYGMLATSTHDNKRSEDVRARINVLSEIPNDWKRRTSRWSLFNKRKKVEVDGDLVPSRNDEYLLYQTLVGTWPFEKPTGDALQKYCARIQAYMVKAIREGKQNSSWIEPNEAYENAVSEFIESILTEEPKNSFRRDFEPFAEQVAHYGMWNSLGQLTLKLASPGVPDFYQGSELWDFRLVDPDNREPVDYAVREQLLESLQSALGTEGPTPQLAEQLVNQATDSRIKLFVMSQLLHLRRSFPDLFTSGDYMSLELRGTASRNVCAFARRSGDRTAIIAVPRLIVGLTQQLSRPPLGEKIWDDTSIALPEQLSSDSWTNVFTGETCPRSPEGTLKLASLCHTFPIAVLINE